MPRLAMQVESPPVLAPQLSPEGDVDKPRLSSPEAADLPPPVIDSVLLMDQGEADCGERVGEAVESCEKARAEDDDEEIDFDDFMREIGAELTADTAAGTTTEEPTSSLPVELSDTPEAQPFTATRQETPAAEVASRQDDATATSSRKQSSRKQDLQAEVSADPHSATPSPVQTIELNGEGDEEKSPSPIPEDPSCAKPVETDEDDDEEEIMELPAPPRQPTVSLTQDGLRRRWAELLARRHGAGADGERRVTDLLRGFLAVDAPDLEEGFLDTIGIRLPSSVTVPPSQVVSLLAIYNEERIREPRPTSTGSQFPAQAFTRSLGDIGLKLVQETVYGDIVHNRKMPSMPRDPDRYAEAVARARPILDELQKSNEHLQLDGCKHRCAACKFHTESAPVLSRHQQQPHPIVNGWLCGVCKFFTRDEEEIEQHLRESHQLEALFLDGEAKAPCSNCERDFPTKAAMLMHLRDCRRQLASRARFALAPCLDDICLVNRRLWPPARDPPRQAVIAPTPPKVLRLTPNILSAAGQPNKHLLPSNHHQARASVVSLQLHPQPARQRLPGPPPPLLRRMAKILPRGNPQPTTGSRQQVPPPPAPSVVFIRPPQDAPVCELCEICEVMITSRESYLFHLQLKHGQMSGKTARDMVGTAPLSCSRCQSRFWTYLGLERHLLVGHGLVTGDLLTKAQNQMDSGKCNLCNKQFAFNLVQHLVGDHHQRLCSAEILYSCDVCAYQCNSYQQLERHLSLKHGAQAHAPLVRCPPPAAPRVPLIPIKRPATSAPVAAPAEPKRPRAHRVKYTCTPCHLRFDTYGQVVAHWQERHLKKVTVPVCRVDSCPKHRASVEAAAKVDWHFPEVVEAAQDVITLD